VLPGGNGTTATESAAPTTHSTTSAPAPPTTTARNTPTKTDTPTPTLPPQRTYQGTTPEPPSRTYNVPIEGDTIMTRHEGALKRAGNFRYNIVTYYRIGNATNVTSETDAMVDLDTRTMSVLQTNDGVTKETYVDESGTGYTQLIDRGISYSRPDPSVTKSSRYTNPSYLWLETLEFSYAGQRFDGGRWYSIYQVNDVDEAGKRIPMPGVGFRRSQVRDVDVEAKIRSDGLIKRIDYRIEGRSGGSTRVYKFSIKYSRLGITNVEQPRWLGTAKRNIDG
jgi:hypothetical protein